MKKKMGSDERVKKSHTQDCCETAYIVTSVVLVSL